MFNLVYVQTLHRHLLLMGVLGLLIIIAAIDLGCQTTPLTQRSQLIIVPESQEIALGLDAYQEVLKGEQLSTNKRYVDMVRRVGNRIATVAGRPDYSWEFNVIASPTQNAFALPGGKVAIYEGILPICQNEAGLAVVMSHEVAHALARHGGERMSQEAVVGGLQKVLDASTQDRTAQQRDSIMAVYGAASKYGFTLPYSRSHELEADHIGLLLMADAGYDPAEAPKFWRRFGNINTEKPPEFISTHPSDERRASDLEKLLPEAFKRYQTASTKYGTGENIVTVNK
jgi:predicted Zn-dependent protease